MVRAATKIWMRSGVLQEGFDVLGYQNMIDLIASRIFPVIIVITQFVLVGRLPCNNMLVFVMKMGFCKHQVFFISHCYQVVSVSIGETSSIAAYNVRVSFVSRCRFRVEVTNSDFQLGFQFLLHSVIEGIIETFPCCRVLLTALQSGA